MPEQLSLTGQHPPPPPLAERMRPRVLDEFCGQAHLLGPGRPLRLVLEQKKVPSCLLWGPPGTGKTTLARLLAKASSLEFVPFSAVMGGLKELRQVIEEATERRRRLGKGTLLFVDEIHHFNKSQQDAFLPHVESGLLNLIGATTENPSFELNAALLSRLEVFTLERLTDSELMSVLRTALSDPERGLQGKAPEVADEVLKVLADQADGDARRALNLLEQAVQSFKGTRSPPPALTLEFLQQVLPNRMLRYDRSAEEHYNIISAFIKSLRGSDADAALYWLARMLEGGENARFIARRLVIFASEDVGNADPKGLEVAVAAFQAIEFVGMPEGIYALSQATLYLAMAPKSNTAKTAFAAARDDARRFGTLPVPYHLRNAPTQLMESMGYGDGYRYPHDFPSHFVIQQYLPDKLEGHRYVRPSGMGYEKRLEEYQSSLRKFAVKEEGSKGG